MRIGIPEGMDAVLILQMRLKIAYRNGDLYHKKIMLNKVGTVFILEMVAKK